MPRGAGADFADARAGTDESESLTVRNQEMEGVDRSTSTGVGIRVLVGGRWGFAATSRLDEAEIDRTARLAVRDRQGRAAAARASPCRLTPVEPATAAWRTVVEEDPFTVPLEEKVALLMEASRRMQEVPGLSFAEAGLDFFRRSTWFASSDGAAIEQVVTHSGGGIEAVARRRRRHAATLLPELVPRTREGCGLRAHPHPGADRGSRTHRQRGGRACFRRPNARARSPRSCSIPGRWSCRSTSRSATRSSSTACSAWRRPTPARRGSPRRTGERCGMRAIWSRSPPTPRCPAGSARSATTTRACRPSACRSSSTARSRTSCRAVRRRAWWTKSRTPRAAPTGGATCR